MAHIIVADFRLVWVFSFSQPGSVKDGRSQENGRLFPRIFLTWTPDRKTQFPENWITPGRSQPQKKEFRETLQTLLSRKGLILSGGLW
jgi:hypothetical protein